MKKYLLLLVLAMMSGLTVKGQFFVASYGHVQAWDLPESVLFTLEDNYWDYDLLHARRMYHHGRVTFDLVLQRGPIFKTVTVNHRGRVLEVSRTNYYPLVNHSCGDFCGFHSNYYYTYYRPHVHGHQHYFGCGHYIPQVKIVYHGDHAQVYHVHKQGPVKYYYDKPHWKNYQYHKNYGHSKKQKGHYKYEGDDRRHSYKDDDYRRDAGRSRATVEVDRGRSTNGYRYSRDQAPRRPYN